MRIVIASAIVLAGIAAGCDTSDVSGSGPCGAGTCGYLDRHYNSTFYCPPQPLIPGGWYGYSWHSNAHCHEECSTASGWGCDAGNCDAGCDQPVGSGSWIPCNAANGGEVVATGCYLESSGVHGETVPCVCR